MSNIQDNNNIEQEETLLPRNNNPEEETTPQKESQDTEENFLSREKAEIFIETEDNGTTAETEEEVTIEAG